MAEIIHLTAADGFELSAYQATPSSSLKGAVVVIQEIFGVNGHIREVVDGYASEGYLAVAPALFDRVEPGIELGYEGADMTQGVQLAFEKLQMPQTLADVQAAIQHAGTHGKVGVVGYCFGGLLTWLSACQLQGVTAASAYYGGGIAGQMAMSPTCPTIMHFGDKDAHIPMSDVEQVKTAQPDVSVYVYSADHGFNCDHRASYDAPSAASALERTLGHFKLHLA